MLTITVFAPPDLMTQSSPRGFSFVEGVFSAARLNDPISVSQKGLHNLERTLRYLLRRYPGRIRVEWINPWSFQGLVFAFRHRTRRFPTILIASAGKVEVLTEENLPELSERVAMALSTTTQQ